MDPRDETIPYEVMEHNLRVLREVFYRHAKETMEGGILKERAIEAPKPKVKVRKRHKNGGNFRIAGVSEFHGPAVAVLERGTCEMIAWTFEPERIKKGLDILAAIEADEVRVVPVPPDPEGT